DRVLEVCECQAGYGGRARCRLATTIPRYGRQRYRGNGVNRPAIVLATERRGQFTVGHGVRQAAPDKHSAGELPAIHEAVPSMSVQSPPDGNLPDIVQIEALPHVIVRRSIGSVDVIRILREKAAVAGETELPAIGDIVKR